MSFVVIKYWYCNISTILSIKEKKVIVTFLILDNIRIIYIYQIYHKNGHYKKCLKKTYILADFMYEF